MGMREPQYLEEFSPLIDTGRGIHLLPNMRMLLSSAIFGSRIRKIIFINNPLNTISSIIQAIFCDVVR